MKYICTMILGILMIGCTKIVDIPSPVTNIDGKSLYKKDGSAIAVLTGIYQEMSVEGLFQGVGSITQTLGAYSDEFIDYRTQPMLTAAYQNALSPTTVPLWIRIYYLIYTCKTAIEGVSTSTTLTPVIKDRLLGEAKFVRAYLYFYLVNIWGDIPMPVKNDYKVNALLSRTKVDEVYNLIVSDLKDAENYLSHDYLMSDLISISSERIRPNKWTAKALLSRIYLYLKNYSEAEKYSSELINNKDLFKLETLSNVFVNSSKEAIWQIQVTNPSWNTFEATSFILTSPPNSLQPLSLSDHLVSAFEKGDLRRNNWVGSYVDQTETYYFPYKYRVSEQNAPISEYLTMFRLGEQILIRAEANFFLGRKTDAIDDVNKIRQRASSTSTTTIPQSLPAITDDVNNNELYDIIMHERHKELFSEMGHRYLDLKRTGLLDKIMPQVSSEKGGTWSSYKSNFPIPQLELLYNPYMTQNMGY